MLTLTQQDALLSKVKELLDNHLKTLVISEMEKISICITVYDLFEKARNLEQIYFDLLDYLEEEENLHSLIPPLKTYFESNHSR